MSDLTPQDRRTERTRAALQRALLELLGEKRYDDIRVRDIADRADIGYSTFYLHYRDVEHLLADTLERTFNDIAGQTRPSPENLRGLKPGLAVFHHVLEERTRYGVIYEGRGSAVLLAQIRRTIANIVRRDVSILLKGRPSPVPMEIVCNYVAGSMLGLILWWLENPRVLEVEETLAHFYRLVEPGLFEALGLDPALRASL